MSWMSSLLMHRSKSGLLIAISAMVLHTANPSEAQRLDLVWQVSPVRGFAAVAAHGLFGPIPEVQLQVTISNAEDAADWIFVEPGFFASIVIEVREVGTERTVAAISRWADEATCGRANVSPCPLSLRSSVPPGGWMRAVSIVVPLEEAEIAEGEYRIVLDFTDATPFLRGVDNAPWRGRLLERGTVPLVIRAPRTPEERREHYRIEGMAALRLRDLSRARDLFQAWMAEFPNEAAGHAAMGMVLIEEGHFAQAAPVLEHALALSADPASGRLPLYLATAYIGSGAEGKAIAMLRVPQILTAIFPEILAALS